MRSLLSAKAGRFFAALASIGVLTISSVSTHAESPIEIGFGMAQTGPLAGAGKSALLAMKIWEDDVNAKGGLLGRPVKLIYYDDQSNPSTVPGIYSKLLDVDKVDLIVGGYATNMLAPAMPMAMQRQKVFIGIFGTAVNSEFKYPRYFSMISTGPDPKTALTKRFFESAAAQSPKPTTVAIVAADAEFARNAADGARANAAKAGMKVVFDRAYPPTTTDFTPIIRSVQATNPDVVVLCSYPLDSAGIVRSVHELDFRPKMIGGAMVGPQTTAFKTQLGPLLNGFVYFDFWFPAKTMNFPGANELIAKYQARAQAEGVDPLGYGFAPWGYAYLQVLAQAIENTKSLDDGKLADYMRAATFKTIAGDVKFGSDGEWTDARVLAVQFQKVRGNGIEQFRDVSTMQIVLPDQYKTGGLIYPFEKARQ
jgi:branched-chain amino acid transport system substrate-binding protein